MVSPDLTLLAAYLPRDRCENILAPGYRLAHEGVALIADISGFTPLTEALARSLSPDRGAEVLTRVLSEVFTPLIAIIHAYRGSVVKFGGDALIVFFPREPRVRRQTVVLRALTVALEMQRAITSHGQVTTPEGPITLRMKIGLTYGPVQRFLLGSPEHGYEDVIAGATLDRMAAAEHHAEPGEVLADVDSLSGLWRLVQVGTRRDDFVVVAGLNLPARRAPWPDPASYPGGAELLRERLALYVPAQVYAALIAGRQPGELKPVVSLFVQFHGLNYDSDPQAGEKLQHYFQTAQQVVARYGGRLNRLITGDKGSLLHIIFGAPRVVEGQETRAVRCALDLQADCGRMEWVTMQRIGLTSGRVFAGPLGAPERRDYTTMGDSINLSARLMQHAAPQQVLLDAATASRLGPEFVLLSLGAISVKGKAEPVAVYAAMSYAAIPTTGAKARRLAPVFGRDRETALLRARFEELRGGRGGVLTLVGEAGTGKTHLLNVLRAGAGVGWATGYGQDYGEMLRGYLVAGALRELLGLRGDAAGERLAAACDRWFGPQQREASYPYLASFLGLPSSTTPALDLASLAGESLRWQIFRLVLALLHAIAGQAPLVLAFDDLQWADSTSLDLIEALLPLTTEVPLLLILAQRPERSSRAWGLRQRLLDDGAADDLVLGPLNHADAKALIAHHSPGLPTELVALLIERGDGRPLFLVELARTMRGQDLPVPGAGVPELPDSVQGLLLAQIDRLSSPARHTLQMAALIGRRFQRQLLEALTDETGLESSLEELLDSEFLIAEPEGQAEGDDVCSFRHVLIQESAYSTLLYERRRVGHRAVAGTIERIYPSRLLEQSGQLAMHYERAGDERRAAGYLLQAADSARLLAANDEAEQTYRRALTLLEQQKSAEAELVGRTYLKLAQVFANRLAFESAQEYYSRAFILLEQAEQTHPRPGTGVSERVLRLCHVLRPAALDPGLAQLTEDVELICDLFEGLVEVDSELNLLPALARRWQISDDGHIYRFELREGLHWSDGTPLTADNFVAAWQRNLHPKTGAPRATLLYPVRGAASLHSGASETPAEIAIHALDDLRLEIELEQPVAYFLYLLSAPVSFPLPPRPLDERGAPVCSGPFMIAPEHGQEQLTLIRNPHYRGIHAGNLDRAEIHFDAPDLARFAEGRTDWLLSEDSPAVLEHFAGRALIVQYFATYFLAFACGAEPFRQRAARLAFAQALDRRALVAQVWEGVQRPATGGVVPPGVPGYSPEIGLPFDPPEARAWLARAGLPSGEPPIRLAAPVAVGRTPAFLCKTWREQLGITVEAHTDLPFDTIIAGLFDGSYQMALLGWDFDYPDADNILRGAFYGPDNCLGWSNPAFDELIERAVSLRDQAERLRLYHHADQILVAEECAVVPLYYQQAYGVLREGFVVEGVQGVLRGGRFRLKHVRLIEQR